MIAADVEELVIKYLSQTFPNVGVDMPPDFIPLPFYLVNGLPSPSDWITEHNIVSVHAFAASRTAAKNAGRAMHAIMNPWVFTPKLRFNLTTGPAHIDRFCIVEKPAHQRYENPNLFRYCGRYRIELRINQTT